MQKKTHLIATRVTQSDYLSLVTNAEVLGASESEYFRRCVTFYNACLSGEHGAGILKEIERRERKREQRKQQFLWQDAEDEEQIAKLKELHRGFLEKQAEEKERMAQEELRKKYQIYNSHLQIPNLYNHLTDESFKDKPLWGLDTRLREIHSNRNLCAEVINEITHLVGCGDGELIPLDENRATYKIVPNGGSR